MKQSKPRLGDFGLGFGEATKVLVEVSHSSRVELGLQFRLFHEEELALYFCRLLSFLPLLFKVPCRQSHQ